MSPGSWQDRSRKLQDISHFPPIPLRLVFEHRAELSEAPHQISRQFVQHVLACVGNLGMDLGDPVLLPPPPPAVRAQPNSRASSRSWRSLGVESEGETLRITRKYMVLVRPSIFPIHVSEKDAGREICERLCIGGPVSCIVSYPETDRCYRVGDKGACDRFCWLDHVVCSLVLLSTLMPKKSANATAVEFKVEAGSFVGWTLRNGVFQIVDRK